MTMIWSTLIQVIAWSQVITRVNVSQTCVAKRKTENAFTNQTSYSVNLYAIDSVIYLCRVVYHEVTGDITGIKLYVQKSESYEHASWLFDVIETREINNLASV